MCFACFRNEAGFFINKQNLDFSLYIKRRVPMENNAFIDFEEKIEDIRERYGLWISNKGRWSTG